LNKIGLVEKLLLNKIQNEGCIHLSLIDPENTNPKEAALISFNLEKYGTTAIMVGGSTVASNTLVDKVVKAIKKVVKIPVILFPNNVTGISKFADAVWFMSLLNSNNPLFISGLQALAAPIIKRNNLEAIPLAYLVIGDGSTVAFVGQANVIPYEADETALSYALAAEYLGIHFVYLEAGSGSKRPISFDMVSVVKKNLNIPVIVGGGIKDSISAATIVKAGADAIVTGTVIENDKSQQKVKEIIDEIKKLNHRHKI